MTRKMTSASDKYFDALNRIDKSDFLACFTPDSALHDPYGGRPFSGSAGLEKWFDGFIRTWNKFSIEAEESYRSGDRLAVKWSADGTASSGKQASFSGVDVFTFDEQGLISRMDGYWDAAAMLEQIR